MNSKHLLMRCGLLLAPVLICLLCLLLLVALPRIREEVVVLQRKQDLSNVKAELNAILEDLPRSENDTLLSSEKYGLDIQRGLLLGCIKGGEKTIYGTTREFEDVTKEYAALFENHTMWTQNREWSYSTKKAWFLLYLYDPASALYPSECVGFPVCYSASLAFADPSRYDCRG